MGQTTKMEIPAVCDEQLVPSFCSGLNCRIKMILSFLKEDIIKIRGESGNDRS
jgi:hypothetical protein